MANVVELGAVLFQHDHLDDDRIHPEACGILHETEHRRLRTHNNQFWWARLFCQPGLSGIDDLLHWIFKHLQSQGHVCKTALVGRWPGHFN